MKPTGVVYTRMSAAILPGGIDAEEFPDGVDVAIVRRDEYTTLVEHSELLERWSEREFGITFTELRRREAGPFITMDAAINKLKLSIAARDEKGAENDGAGESGGMLNLHGSKKFPQEFPRTIAALNAAATVLEQAGFKHHKFSIHILEQNLNNLRALWEKMPHGWTTTDMPESVTEFTRAALDLVADQERQRNAMIFHPVPNRSVPAGFVLQRASENYRQWRYRLLRLADNVFHEQMVSVVELAAAKTTDTIEGALVDVLLIRFTASV